MVIAVDGKALRGTIPAGQTHGRHLLAAYLPAEGWVLRGICTRVQEGNRMQRALIGFGQGQTDVQVLARLDDLAHGTLKPYYEIETDAVSGSQPGAAQTLVLSPYGAAARFVMSGSDLEKNIKQTASFDQCSGSVNQQARHQPTEEAWLHAALAA